MDFIFKMANSGLGDLTLPTAFDTSLGTNFTQSSCPEFFSTFLKNDSFVNCYPMSFFLKNSQSYVNIVRKGLDAVEHVLNVSCAADIEHCTQIMADIGENLISPKHCSGDYSLQNPLVIQAYNDFFAYSQVYQATCLHIPSDETPYVGQNNSSPVSSSSISQSGEHGISSQTSSSLLSITSTANKSDATSTVIQSKSLKEQKRDDIFYDQDLLSMKEGLDFNKRGNSTNHQKATYCYSDALFSMVESSSDDAYLYLLPLGISFPSSSTPSCFQCTKDVMAIFHSYTNSTNNVITSTYNSASSIIAQKCASNFVNTSIIWNESKSQKSSASELSHSPNRLYYFVTFILIFLSFFSINPF